MPEVEPRIISPRRPGTATDGPRMARLSAGLGRPLMPHQRTTLDLVGEVDPVTRRRTRALVVITKQRQSGKTEDVKTLMVDRALLCGPAQRVWYTAQTGQYARDKWAELATELCAKESPLAGYVAARWAKGDECLTLPNGSTIRPFPPTRDALHSKQADLVVVDEAWRHDPIRGQEIIQAASPAMATRPGAQLALVSTMGTAASTWWHSWVDRGRAGDPAVTFVEYGIGDDADPDDLDLVIAAHPAVGHTIPADFIRGERAKMTRNEFARAYGNARTASDERHIDATLWKDAATEDPLPDLPLALAAAVSIDRSRAAILACAGGIVEVVESRPGVTWAAARMIELVKRHRPAAVDVHRVGPSGTLRDELARAGVALADTTPADYATACVDLMDRLEGGRVHYRRHANLDAAADAAVPRPTGDGGWQWGRRLSGGPIPEIEAMTLATWLDEHRSRRGKPRVVTRSGASPAA